MPIKLFYSICPITACCFHSANYNIIFGGLQDGYITLLVIFNILLCFIYILYENKQNLYNYRSISLWDLKEDEMWHHKITDKANNLDWTIRIPTYTTATNIDINIHTTQIVAVRVLSKIEEKSLVRCNNKFIPIQVC